MTSRKNPTLTLKLLWALAPLLFLANPASRAETLVGTLPGDVSVDNKGAANYSIPIEVIPGRGGMQPSLALSYNSSGGNGLMGVGWSLSAGVSKIERGRTILARDGFLDGPDFDANDEFYLDGKRLIAVSEFKDATGYLSGSSFRTEVDSFSLIEAKSSQSGNPSGQPIDYFEVRAKDGRTMTYALGETYPGSPVYPNTSNQIPFGYSLTKVEDLQGNHYVLAYDYVDHGDSAEYRIKEIKYNPNSSSVYQTLVSFSYNLDVSPTDEIGTEREDGAVSYVSGVARALKSRLDRVEVAQSSETVAKYTFNYRHSDYTSRLLLDSISPELKSLSDGLGLRTLNPIELSYSDAVDSNGNPVASSFLESHDIAGIGDALGQTWLTNIRYVADHDGDGVNSIITVNNGAVKAVSMPTAPGGSETTVTLMDQANSGYGVFGNIATHINASRELHWNGDFDLDGDSDFIFYSASPAGYYLCLSNGTSLAPPVLSLGTNTPSSRVVEPSHTVVTDVNGDGRLDLVSVSNPEGVLDLRASAGDPPAEAAYLCVAYGEAGGFEDWQEVMALDQRIEVDENQYIDEVYLTIHPVEFNGDGKRDFVVKHRTGVNWYGGVGGTLASYEIFGSSFAWADYGSSVLLSSESGFQKMADVPPYLENIEPEPLYDLPHIDEARFGDFNGDGLTDVHFTDASENYFRVYLYYCQGDGTFKQASEINFSLASKTGNVMYDSGVVYPLGAGEVWEEEVEEDEFSTITHYHLESTPAVFISDFDGDGKDDYVWRTITGVGDPGVTFDEHGLYYPNNGNLFDEWVILHGGDEGFRQKNGVYEAEKFTTLGMPNDLFNGEAEVADMTGDGAVDFVWKSTSTIWKFFRHALGRPDLLANVTDGLGRQTEIAYRPLTDSSVYVKGSGASYPIKENIDSRYVVSDLYKDAGGNFAGGDKYRFSYSYSGNRTDLSGRGSLGFHSFVTYDHQTDLLSYQFLSQSFPMTGLAKREQTFRAYNVQKDGQGSLTNFDLLPISSQDNDVTFDEVNLPGTGLKGTVYPFMSHSQKLSWEDHAANALTLEVENPESLFDEYNSTYDENEQLAHSRINTHVWFDDQSLSSDSPTELPLGYDDSAAYVSGQQDGVAVGFEAWNAQLDAIELDAGSAHGKITYGNVRRTRVDYGDGFTSDTVTTYHSPSTYSVGLTGLVDETRTTGRTPTDVDGQGSPVKGYTYYADTGLVATEETDAGDASVFNANSALDTTKTFTYNSYGLLQKTEIGGHAGAGNYYVGSGIVLSEVETWDPTYRYPEKTKNAYGHWTKTFFRDPFGRPGQVNDINDDNETTGGTETEYDALGRVTLVDDRLRGLSATTTIGETSAGASDHTKTQTVSVPGSIPSDHTAEMADALALSSKYYERVDPNDSPAATTYFDRLGRAVRVIKEAYNGQQAIVDTVYDLQGRVVAVSNPYESPSSTKYWSFTTYDELGRPYFATAPNGTKTTTLYYGRVTQVTVDATDRAPQTTTTLVNAKGDTVKVWNADNVPTNLFLTRVDDTPSLEYVLDGFGRMVRTEAWQGSDRPTGVPEFLTVYAEYDALGSQTRLDDPDKGVWDYIYNGLGQLAWQSSPEGGVVTTEYDKLGRSLSRHTQQTDNSETAAWTYYDDVDDSATNRVKDTVNGWIGSVQKESVITTDSKWSDNDGQLSAKSYYYDLKGNPKTALEWVDGKWMYRYLRYDSKNRLEYLDYYWRTPGHEDNPHVYPYEWRRYGIQNVFDSDGYVTSVTAGDSASPAQYDTWWQADSSNGYDYMDRPGVFTKGQGHSTTLTYDAITGTLGSLVTGASGSIQSDTYAWDGLGNLASRTNRLSKTETFAYDILNRLTSSTVGSTVRSNAYYDNGSIKTKQSVTGAASGAYSYDAEKPHAVASAFGYSLDYDESGNVKSRSGNGETWAFRWNASDKPHWMGREISSSASGSAFRYGVDRMRVAHYEFDSFDKTGGSNPEDWTPGHYTRKKIYVGGGSMEYDFENVAAAGSDPMWRVKRHRIYVPSPEGKAGAVEIDPYGVTSSAYDRQVYHYDHLGSIAAITPFASTASTASSYHDDRTGRDNLYSYNSWGQRRDPLDWVGDPVSTSFGGDDDWSTRGYTGHEMLDDIGLVHMNGRIYDPLLGRMLSADIVVQFPEDLQNYNRYSYTLNNPLTHTDPTGYEVTRDAVIPFSKLIENVQRWESLKFAKDSTTSPSDRLGAFYSQIEENAMFDPDTGATRLGDAKVSELGWHYVHTSEGWIDMGHFSNAAKFAETGYLLIDDAKESIGDSNVASKIVSKLLDKVDVEGLVKTGGLGVEIGQSLTNFDPGPLFKNSTRTSALTREDFGSNRLGAEFATFLRSNEGNYSNLSDALKDFLGQYNPSEDPEGTDAFQDLTEGTQESLDSRGMGTRVGRLIGNAFRNGFSGSRTIFGRSKPPEEEEL